MKTRSLSSPCPRAFLWRSPPPVTSHGGVRWGPQFEEFKKIIVHVQFNVLKFKEMENRQKIKRINVQKKYFDKKCNKLTCPVQRSEG